MELGLREWLIIGGAIVVFLIVLDGWRRMRGGGNSLRMKIDQTMVDLPEEDYNPELPGGGARVIDQNGNPVEQRQEPTLDDLTAVAVAPESSPVVEDPPLRAGTDELSAPRRVTQPDSDLQFSAAETLATTEYEDPVPVAARTVAERDPLFEPLNPVGSDVDQSDSAPEPLADLDEGISAVRVVPAVERDAESEQVPLVDTIVSPAAERSPEPVSAEPDVVADADPLFDAIAPVAEPEQPQSDAQTPALADTDDEPQLAGIEPQAMAAPEQEFSIQEHSSDIEVAEPAVDDISAVAAEPTESPVDDVPLVEIVASPDREGADEVVVEDDVLDLAFLHQYRIDETDDAEQPPAETEPVMDDSESGPELAEAQPELFFSDDETDYQPEEDDLIASLPEGFSAPAAAMSSADDHDETELDLSRPVSELMYPAPREAEPQQTAMDLTAGEEPVRDDLVAAVQDSPQDYELHEHFSAEREPQLTEDELSAIAAVDEPADSAALESEPLQAELVTPALQPPKQTAQQAAEAPRQNDPKPMPQIPEADKVLVISVVAPKQRPAFSGRSLLQILMACGMRYGDMKIFHRYEDGIDQGAVQFSMANAVEPGYFDIDSMETMETRGVTFFMSMEEPRDVMNAYECMLGTAEAVANNLHGNLLDENRSTMRSQTKEHYRERIRSFEMRKLKQSSGV